MELKVYTFLVLVNPAARRSSKDPWPLNPEALSRAELAGAKGTLLRDQKA